jgi:HAD superfamily hydrolase (TIGR01490 family)
LRPAAVFDLDGTLLPRTSAERLFIRHALRAGALHPVRVLAGLGAGVAAWLAGRAASPFEHKGHLRGARCAPLETLGVALVHTEVLPRLRRDLLDLVETHRRRGDALVLLSGTLDFLGAEIARALRFDHVVACALERREGRFTGRLGGRHPHGGGKAALLHALAEEHGLDLSRSAAYANRASDRAHLELVAEPFAVSPDAALRRHARRHGWRIWEDGGAAMREGGAR